MDDDWIAYLSWWQDDYGHVVYHLKEEDLYSGSKKENKDPSFYIKVGNSIILPS